MNDWKELKIDDLPSDILVGDYEFEVKGVLEDNWRHSGNCKPKSRPGIIRGLSNGTHEYRYRKRQPEPPSHEEIMTKWWCDILSDEWYRVLSYKAGKYILWGSSANRLHPSLFSLEVDKEWFEDRKSATIPPEAK